ncbi:MAG: hypothetical protein EXS32_03105 [Opitutus sp.]|nr:hypothetical protein [Opitutus sp.]
MSSAGVSDLRPLSGRQTSEFLLAYLLALQDGPDDAYRATMARKIDEQDSKRWITLDELDQRLAAKKN